MNDVMNYEDEIEFGLGYSAGYEACKEEMRQRAFRRKEESAAKKRRNAYFLMQKLIGVFMLVLTVIGIILLEGDATIAIVTVPIGLALIFSRNMLWTNSYYYEMEKKKGASR